MTGAALASRPTTRRAGFLQDPPLQAVYPLPTSIPGPAALAETPEGSAEAYWYLHGFRTGREDERHEAPPFWQLRNSRAWKRGRRDGITYI